MFTLTHYQTKYVITCRDYCSLTVHLYKHYPNVNEVQCTALIYVIFIFYNIS